EPISACFLLQSVHFFVTCSTLIRVEPISARGAARGIVHHHFLAVPSSGSNQFQPTPSALSVDHMDVFKSPLTCLTTFTFCSPHLPPRVCANSSLLLSPTRRLLVVRTILALLPLHDAPIPCVLQYPHPGRTNFSEVCLLFEVVRYLLAVPSSGSNQFQPGTTP